MICVGLLVGAAACSFTIEGAPPPAASDGAPITDDAAIADLTPAIPPDMTVLPGNIGDACPGKCAGVLTCMNWVPAGYCSRGCDTPCPPGTTCVDIGTGARYCLLNASGGCTRPDLMCRDCGADVCAPPSFCGGC